MEMHLSDLLLMIELTCIALPQAKGAGLIALIVVVICCILEHALDFIIIVLEKIDERQDEGGK